MHHIHHYTCILFLLFLTLFSMLISVSNYLFSCKNKSMNNGWDGKWQRSEAILSLLIKLSAWRPVGITKAWNCLTFFLFTLSAISYFTVRKTARASESHFGEMQGFVKQCDVDRRTGHWTIQKYGRERSETVEVCNLVTAGEHHQAKSCARIHTHAQKTNSIQWTLTHTHYLVKFQI